MPDTEGAAAAGAGKRAKKKAVRSSQKAPAAADPVRDEAAAKVGGIEALVLCCDGMTALLLLKVLEFRPAQFPGDATDVIVLSYKFQCI
jgi:hypothetical protein